MRVLSNLRPKFRTDHPIGACIDSYGRYDSPPYRIEDRIGDLEIRRYSPHLLAEVTVAGDRSDALERGFRLLAEFIFGGNQGSRKVSMTSPVEQSRQIDMTSPVTEKRHGDAWTVTFMMPHDQTVETLPIPNNSSITFVRRGVEKRAVLEFSGRPTTEIMAEKEEELRTSLQRHGLRHEGSASYAYFDAPMTPPWARRNEVSFQLVT